MFYGRFCSVKKKTKPEKLWLLVLSNIAGVSSFGMWTPLTTWWVCISAAKLDLVSLGIMELRMC